MPTTKVEEQQEQQLVVFDLSGELFAIGIERINTIIRMEPVTRLPGMAEFIEGVINLRGSILPVIDPRKKFGLPLKETDKTSRIVVVEIHSLMVGLIVDAVTETIRLSTQEIEPPADTITSTSTNYVSGIGKAGDKLLILLNLDQLLSREHLRQVLGITDQTVSPEADLAAV